MKFKLLDANTSLKELITEFWICFIYGFSANSITVFIINNQKIAVFINFLFYYSLVSLIITRKYTTILGKFILFPIASSLGALSAVYLFSKI